MVFHLTDKFFDSFNLEEATDRKYQVKLKVPLNTNAF